MSSNKENTGMLIPPCSYQGGKQRLAKSIVDIIFSNSMIDENTKFFDLCCGSGAISLEIINRGIHPNNITMIDKGCYGMFWQMVANDEFSLTDFKKQIDALPSIEYIQDYLQNLSKQPVDDENMVYHYLLLQAGAFGSKQIWVENGVWKNTSFRSYWTPTATSNRRSVVNPMMPMPNTIYERVNNIVSSLSGCITAHNDFVEKYWHYFDADQSSNVVIYIDPPYMGTTQYGFRFDPIEAIMQTWNGADIYVSEGYEMDKSLNRKNSWLLSNGRTKGNITGNVNKKPVAEWLNYFNNK